MYDRSQTEGMNAMTSMSSLEFNQDAGKARQLAEREPVFITDRGTASHVLLSIDAYRRLSGQGKNPPDALAINNDIDFRTVEFD